jgi:hypothetical protein
MCRRWCTVLRLWEWSHNQTWRHLPNPFKHVPKALEILEQAWMPKRDAPTSYKSSPLPTGFSLIAGVSNSALSSGTLYAQLSGGAAGWPRSWDKCWAHWILRPQSVKRKREVVVLQEEYGKIGLHHIVPRCSRIYIYHIYICRVCVDIDIGDRCVYTHMYILYIYTCKYTCIYVYMFTCIHVFMYIYMHTYLHT